MNYTHILARVFGVPLAIHEPKLEQILAGLGPRLFGQAAPRALSDDDLAEQALRPRRKPYAIDSAGVATIPVLGVLVQRAGQMDPLSTPLTSYESLHAMLSMALDDKAVEAVLLDIDSPGGEASGAFEFAEAIMGMRGRKPIVAAANSYAMSAAYAIASAADHVVVSASGQVGSIGIVAVHVNQAGADAQAGLQYEFLHAGAKKVDGHGHAPLSEAARADLMGSIQTLYGMFTGQVARARGMTDAAVRGTEAGMFLGADAVAIGLADSLGTIQDAAAEAARRAAQARRGGTTSRSKAMNDEEVAALRAEQDAARAAAVLEAERTTRSAASADAAKIVELCMLAGRPQDAAGHITAGRTAGEVSEALLRARATEDPKTATRSGHAVEGTGAVATDPTDPHGWNASIARVCGTVRA